MVCDETISLLREKYQALAPLMDERTLRRWAAAEARALGWGGASAVAKATGISRTTIRSGLAELDNPGPEPPPQRVRRPGAGRPCLTDGDPKLLDDLHKLLDIIIFVFTHFGLHLDAGDAFAGQRKHYLIG